MRVPKALNPKDSAGFGGFRAHTLSTYFNRQRDQIGGPPVVPGMSRIPTILALLLIAIPPTAGSAETGERLPLAKSERKTYDIADDSRRVIGENDGGPDEASLSLLRKRMQLLVF